MVLWIFVGNGLAPFRFDVSDDRVGSGRLRPQSRVCAVPFCRGCGMGQAPSLLLTPFGTIIFL